MQLPFSNKLLGSTVNSEEKQERRQQQLRRLQELNARRREEKLQLDQERLDRLLCVQVLVGPGRGASGGGLGSSGGLVPCTQQHVSLDLASFIYFRPIISFML